MPGLKFAANLSWMFAEAGGLPARYSAARQAGFTAVECGFPYGEDLDALVAAKEASGLEHVLINAWPGDQTKGYMGLAALPNHEDVFKLSLEQSIKYAKALKCTRVHVMSGTHPAQWSDSAMEEVYLENMRFAVSRLHQEGITTLIEAINNDDVPGYFIEHPDRAVEIIKKINHPSLKLQLDLFHMQIVSGNLTANIKKYLPYTDHIQIAQVPNRQEPDTPGEINFDYIFSVLEDAGYDGWVGLEYTPAGSTKEGLNWMSKFK